MTNLNAIIVRQASNDFEAFLIANAMQGLGYVDVVSIVCHPVEPVVHGGSSLSWHVYAKYADDMRTTEQIDEAIDLAMVAKGG